MSVSSMANLAYARRKDVEARSRSPRDLNDVAGEKGQKSETASGGTSALEAIAAYIPTEVITLYIAVLATLGVTVSAETTAGQPATANAAAAVVTSPMWVYVLFLILTPIVTWALYATKAVTAKKNPPLSLAAWPKWEMVAGTLAFAVWAAALPGSPLGRFDWFTAALAGVIALVVSFLLGLFAPLFSRAGLANE